MDAGTRPTWDELRISMRKAQILEAAARVFTRKGYHRATTKEIAGEAGVSEGTIYNYFDSKDALLVGMMGQLAEAQQLDEKLSEGLDSNTYEFVVSMLRDRQDFMRRNYTMLLPALSEILVRPKLAERYYQEVALPVFKVLERHLKERIARGQMRPINVGLAVRIISATVMGLLLLFALGDPLVQSQWDELAEVMASLLVKGFEREQTERA